MIFKKYILKEFAMPKLLPLGIDDFKDLRTGGYQYIDKSLFIKELIDAGPSKVTLIPRPRRFGKTLNMSMLKYFFEKSHAHTKWHETNQSHLQLFDGLEITKHTEYMKHQGQYPIIYLTFKDIKSDTWEDCYDKLKKCIGAEFERHSYILQKSTLTAQQQEDFNQIVNRKASQATFETALQDLSLYLQKHYNSKVIILIDEYDSPIHAGFIHGYYEKIVSFTRGLMCAGLKGNSNLAYGVITGILRVAKESIFSGMNNLNVHTLLSNNYADKFGFTESEVKDLITTYQLSSKLDDVRAWYNGYRIGQPTPSIQPKDGPRNCFTMVYNPWSILNFVSEKGTFGDYWVNTSDNKIIQELVQKSSEDVKKDFELILTGKSVDKIIAEDISFLTIHNDSDALWSFLVFSGYLTWESRELMQIRCHANLIAPNIEVLDCLKRLVNQWFTESIGGGAYKNMLEALKQGDVPSFKRFFEQSVLTHLSYFDITGQTPERVYHAYALGLLVGLSATHEVKSNRESGLGRYDVCVIPHDKSKPGTIIEFKAFNPEQDKDMQAAASAALTQIEENQYETELRSRGTQKIIKLAIVFEGKRVLIVSR
jgi:hypothetical protein